MTIRCQYDYTRDAMTECNYFSTLHKKTEDINFMFNGLMEYFEHEGKILHKHCHMRYGQCDVVNGIGMNFEI